MIPTPLRAVVVNDVNLARWALHHALTNAGFAVTVAETMDEAAAAVAYLDTLDVVVVSLSYGPDSINRLLAHVSARRPEPAVILLATDVDPRVPLGADNRAIVLDTPFSMDDVVAAARRFTPTVASSAGEGLVLPLIPDNDSRVDT